MKKLTQIQVMHSVRKTWGFDPTSRVVKSKKQYNRRKFNSDDE